MLTPLMPIPKSAPGMMTRAFRHDRIPKRPNTAARPLTPLAREDEVEKATRRLLVHLSCPHGLQSTAIRRRKSQPRRADLPMPPRRKYAGPCRFRQCSSPSQCPLLPNGNAHPPRRSLRLNNPEGVTGVSGFLTFRPPRRCSQPLRRWRPQELRDYPQGSAPFSPLPSP